MQLSWIDPEALRDLAAKLQDPAPSAPLRSPSEPFHSIGGSKAIETDMFGFRPPTEPGTPVAPLASTPPAAPPVAEVPAAREPLPQPTPPPPSDDQVARIREQLLAIRSKAVEAGLLQPEPPPLAPQAPEVPAAMPQAAPAPAAPPTNVLAALVMPLSGPEVPNPTPSPVPGPASAHSSGQFLPLEGDLGRRLESYGKWASNRAPSDEMLLVDDHGDVLWSTATRSDLAFSALLALNAALRSSAGGVCHPPKVIRAQASETQQLTILPCTTRHGTVTLAMLNSQPVPDATLEVLREGLILAVEGR